MAEQVWIVITRYFCPTSVLSNLTILCLAVNVDKLLNDSIESRQTLWLEHVIKFWYISVLWCSVFCSSNSRQRKNYHCLFFFRSIFFGCVAKLYSFCMDTFFICVTSEKLDEICVNCYWISLKCCKVLRIYVSILTKATKQTYLRTCRSKKEQGYQQVLILMTIHQNIKIL